MENFWTYTLWGNTIKDYLISICAFTITALILWLFKNKSKKNKFYIRVKQRLSVLFTKTANH